MLCDCVCNVESNHKFVLLVTIRELFRYLADTSRGDGIKNLSQELLHILLYRSVEEKMLLMTQGTNFPSSFNLFTRICYFGIKVPTLQFPTQLSPQSPLPPNPRTPVAGLSRAVYAQRQTPVFPLILYSLIHKCFFTNSQKQSSERLSKPILCQQL